MTLFFHFFKTQNNPNYANDFGLLSLRQNIRHFKTYSDRVKHFKNYFYLVTPLNKEAQAKISHLEPGHPPICIYNFYKYWIKSHYLMGVRSYIYKVIYLSHKDLYFKTQLMAIYKELGYVGGVVSYTGCQETD